MANQERRSAKEELVEALRETGNEVAARLRAISRQTYERGCYENGWTGREILAHVASIEWTYPRLIDLAQQASQPFSEGRGGERLADPPRASGGGYQMRGGNAAYNARQVEKRANMSIEELVQEFKKTA